MQEKATYSRSHVRYRQTARKQNSSWSKIALVLFVGMILFATINFEASSLYAFVEKSFFGGTHGIQTQNFDPAYAKQTLLTRQVPVNEINNTRHLELINHNFPITQEPHKNSLTTTYPQVASSSDSMLLNIAALDALTEMLRDAQQNAPFETLCLTSGYRDLQKQISLYEQAVDKSYVQQPNHSEHQSGLAADIWVMEVEGDDISQTQTGQWLKENSWQYGYILRYAQDKTNITKISAESWHFRYIGKPHAWFSWKNNLCFEEYISHLKETGGYRATYNGITYTVLYVLPNDGIVNVPDHANYSISSDNTGGYLITIWE